MVTKGKLRDQAISSKRKLQKLQGNSADIFRSYLSISSIHGLSYLTAKDTSWFSKIVWLLLVILAFMFGGLMVKMAMKNWDENPVLITLDNVAQPYDKIPYPTITICPNIGYDRWGAVVFKLNDIYRQCDKEGTENSCEALKQFDFLMDYLKEKFMDLLDTAIEKKLVVISNPKLYSGLQNALKAKKENDHKVMEVLPQVMWDSLYKGSSIINDYLDVPGTKSYYNLATLTNNITEVPTSLHNTITKMAFFLSFPNRNHGSFGSLMESLVPTLVGRSFSNPAENPYTELHHKNEPDAFFPQFQLSDLEMRLHKSFEAPMDELSLFEIPAMFNAAQDDSVFDYLRHPDLIFPY